MHIKKFQVDLLSSLCIPGIFDVIESIRNRNTFKFNATRFYGDSITSLVLIDINTAWALGFMTIISIIFTPTQRLFVTVVQGWKCSILVSIFKSFRRRTHI